MLLLGVGEPDRMTVSELLGSPCPSGLAATVSHSWSLLNTSIVLLNKIISSFWLGAFNWKLVLIYIVAGVNIHCFSGRGGVSTPTPVALAVV